ncbi:hypothetical protein [Azospirillum sp. SYSU D00513]|uniref:hypothetical protein n=1 Tax=Azospirillum sp. SYSU D00513 TaxID=2812561 RepID=UPI001A97A994|nr:hypothetical protein [Azospirillum sp. SYSU D00513]
MMILTKKPLEDDPGSSRIPAPGRVFSFEEIATDALRAAGVTELRPMSGDQLARNYGER